MRRIVIVLAVAAMVTAAAPARAGGGGGCHDDVSTQKTGTAIDMKGLCFWPTVLHVKVGQTVTWTNVDDAPHSITGMPGTFDTPEDLVKGDKFTWTFSQAGTFAYYCVIHRRMAGAVVVGDGGPAGLLGTDGTGGTGRVSSAATDTTPVAAKGTRSAALPMTALAIAIPIAAGLGFGVGRRRVPVLPS